MHIQFNRRARAAAAYGPFESPARARLVLSAEAIAAAIALMAAFSMMTGLVAYKTFGC
ncbi:MAG: hypothetical protein KGM42_09665 [Hyphomicrobiales bacterium]|nr:hypothetical protein [Hyphomicrobiales bacterium]